MRLFQYLNSAAAVAVTVAALTLPGIARADDPAFVTGGIGGFDVHDNNTTGVVMAQYRSDKKFFYLKPFAGIDVNFDYGGMVYAGVLMDIYLGRRIVVTPTFAPGIYWQGDSKDLGYPVEFRSMLEVSYRFDDRSRLGVAFGHISNASLSSDNPGTELLLLTYSHPFSDLFGR